MIMNKSEQAILEMLTGNAWENSYGLTVCAFEKRLVMAVKSLMKTKIITVTEHDINTDPYYIVRLNLPAYVCEDCESKYNDRD